MQRLKSARQWRPQRSPRRGLPTTRERHRRELRWGIAGALFVTVLLVAATIMYVAPPGRRTYIAELTEAHSVKPGDDVRVAGIPVGTVSSLELLPDRVLMRFTVADDVFLGDRTSLDIRMLTVVGGHYVAVFPGGGAPLGVTPIPTERVRLPYSLAQTFQDAVEPVRAIDGATARENLAALADSLTAGPDSLRQMLDGAGRFVEVLNSQRADVSKAIAIADEYLGAVAAAKGGLHQLIDQINLLETMLIDKRVEVREAVRTLTRFINRIAALQPAWATTFEPMGRQLAAAIDELDNIGERLTGLIDGVHAVAGRFGALVLPDGTVAVDQSGMSAPPAPGVDPAALLERVCIPIPGKAC